MTFTDLIDYLTEVRDLHGDLRVKVLEVPRWAEVDDQRAYVDPSARVLSDYIGLTSKTLVIEP